jgi:hypothetical protein
MLNWTSIQMWWRFTSATFDARLPAHLGGMTLKLCGVPARRWSTGRCRGPTVMNIISWPKMHTWEVRARVTIGAVALVALVHQSLLTNLDSAASTRAQDISSLVSSASVPATLPAQPDDSNLIQVVD